MEFPKSAIVKLNGYFSRGVKAAEVNAAGHLVLTLTDGSTADLGNVIGPQGKQGEPGQQGIQGEPGISPTVTAERTGRTTTVTVTGAEGETSFDVEDGAEDVFWAVYGETTFAEILEASNNGKMVAAVYSTSVYHLQLVGKNVGSAVFSTAVQGGTEQYLLVNRQTSKWSFSTAVCVPKTKQLTLAASGWTESDGWQTQKVSVFGVSGSYKSAPLIDVYFTSNDAEANAEIAAAWAAISEGMVFTVGGGAITVKFPASVAVPEVNIPVQITTYDMN